jgi:hypothetical protein
MFTIIHKVLETYKKIKGPKGFLILNWKKKCTNGITSIVLFFCDLLSSFFLGLGEAVASCMLVELAHHQCVHLHFFRLCHFEFLT